jgi:hypothetical protein
MNTLATLGNKILAEANGPEISFREAYRNLLFGQFRSLPPSTAFAEVRKDADEIVHQGETVSWEDLYRLEAALIQLEPAECLLRRSWTVRSEFKNIATPDELKDYIASKPPEPDKEGKVNIEALRNDLLRLQHELNWHYLLVWAFESFRSHITKWLCRLGMLTFLSALLAIWLLHDLVGRHLGLNLSMAILIVGAGVLGGLTSTLRRIQQTKYSGNADVALARLDHSNMSIYVSPVLGGVFSLLLFFLFAGGLIKGTIFPEVTLEIIKYVPNSPPIEGVNLAKLLVWSFIAGFAEKLVPDRLQRIAAGAESSVSSKEAGRTATANS